MRGEIVPRPDADRAPVVIRQTYKFQRLREQIRDAILSGEIRGRLPGERDLARRYRANAKTVNKALGDLCSEGLVVRDVGRGTFVADDRTAKPGRRRRFFGVAVSEPVSAPHRADLMRRVEARLAAEGHRLEMLSVRVEERSGSIPLTAWPAALRHQTDGILCCPADPLTGARGGPDAAFVAEALRRHIPMVMLGAGCAEARLSSVTPDYADAGFRLAEHLWRAGCRQMAVVHAGSGAAAALGGTRAAGIRAGRTVSEIAVPASDSVRGDRYGISDPLEEIAGAARDSPHLMTGIIYIGGQILRTLAAAHGKGSALPADRVLMACVAEPGESFAPGERITTYAVDLDLLAAWAMRLLLESKPGHRPIEVLVPGRIRIADEPAGEPPGTMRMEWSSSHTESLVESGGAPFAFQH